MENWTDLVVAIAALAIPVVFGYITKKFAGNQKALDLIKAIEPLAKYAVVMAEKLGLDEKLTGAMKQNKAVEYVMNGLAALGFDNADAEIIRNAVEKAFMEAQEQLHSVYGDK